MIRFSLYCEHGHEFEGWFASNEDYDKQKKTGLISCPSCGSAHVEKALMAPYIATKKQQSDENASSAMKKEEQSKKEEGQNGNDRVLTGREAALHKLLLLQQMQRQKLETLHKLQDIARKMRENAENVGDEFAEEARKIHFGETEKRPIYGEAKKEEVDSLLEDGVDVVPLPDLPEDKN